MKDYKSIILLLLVICVIMMALTMVASADPNLRIGAKSAALYEPTSGKFLYSKNMNTRLPMASTTKIMTGLIAIERSNLDEVIAVPPEGVGVEGSSVYLTEGDTLTVRDLVYSLLLQSANDAATVLAIKIGGDEAAFADIMNNRALEMGLTDTHFDNPHGLDSETHYTTAHDLAVMTGVALENTTFRRIVSTYKYSFRLSDKTRTVVNHNKLLRSYDGCIGVKTGYTKRCGRCLVGAAERDGMTLISVTLDDPDDWRDHTAMLDYGFGNYERVPTDSVIHDFECSIYVINGVKDNIAVCVKSPEEIYLIRPKGTSDFSYEVSIEKSVNAPIEIGDKLGEIVFKRDGDTVAIGDVVAAEAVDTPRKKKFNIFEFFKT